MTNNESERELVLQTLRTWMAFRQAVQRVLKRHNVDMTFEMLQVMNCLWNKQGISQQSLAEKTAKDKACLTNLINNLSKEKLGDTERRPLRPPKPPDFPDAPRRRTCPHRETPDQRYLCPNRNRDGGKPDNGMHRRSEETA